MYVLSYNYLLKFMSCIHLDCKRLYPSILHKRIIFFYASQPHYCGTCGKDVAPKRVGTRDCSLLSFLSNIFKEKYTIVYGKGRFLNSLWLFFRARGAGGPPGGAWFLWLINVVLQLRPLAYLVCVYCLFYLV